MIDTILTYYHMAWTIIEFLKNVCSSVYTKLTQGNAFNIYEGNESLLR